MCTPGSSCKYASTCVPGRTEIKSVLLQSRSGGHQRKDRSRSPLRRPRPVTLIGERKARSDGVTEVQGREQRVTSSAVQECTPQSADTEPQPWIRRITTLAPEQLTAHVVAHVIEQTAKETQHSAVPPELASLHEDLRPRQRIQRLKDAKAQGLPTQTINDYGDELALRTKIASISKSASVYASGLRCWGSFCDLLEISPHFPARESDIHRFSIMFRNAKTYAQYLKHIRFGHRLLSYRTTGIQNL